jgi:hypothetical protein
MVRPVRLSQAWHGRSKLRERINLASTHRARDGRIQRLFEAGVVNRDRVGAQFGFDKRTPARFLVGSAEPLAQCWRGLLKRDTLAGTFGVVSQDMPPGLGADRLAHLALDQGGKRYSERAAELGRSRPAHWCHRSFRARLS